MTEIKATSPMPLYLQIQRKIQQMIYAGKVRPGSRLPSENNLADQFGVARMTIRQALEHLAQENIIYKKQGVGTFVTEESEILMSKLAFPPSLSMLLKTNGYTPSSDILKKQVTDQIPGGIRDELRLQPGDLVLYTKRLRLGNDIPMAINHSWLPEKLVPGMADEPFVDGSIIKTLIERYQLLPSVGVEWVESTLATNREARLLQIPLQSPLLLMTSISTLYDDTPIEYSKTLWRTDKLRLQINSRDFSITFRDEMDEVNVRD